MREVLLSAIAVFNVIYAYLVFLIFRDILNFTEEVIMDYGFWETLARGIVFFLGLTLILWWFYGNHD